MSGLFPEGLTQKEFELLNKCERAASGFGPGDLLEKAKEHLQQVKVAYQTNPFVNYALATAIYNNFESIVSSWNDMPKHCHPWLKGMIWYFSLSSDLEDDFISPIGFDDDVEIMNACLKLSGYSDLCINPEDYDDV